MQSFEEKKWKFRLQQGYKEMAMRIVPWSILAQIAQKSPRNSFFSGNNEKGNWR